MKSNLWHWRRKTTAEPTASPLLIKNVSPLRFARSKKRLVNWRTRRELTLHIRELFNSAFEDRELSEKISLLSSPTLDVELGEVLVSSRYHRIFELGKERLERKVDGR